MAKTMKQWTVAGKSGFDDMKYDESAPIPEIGDKDVLVKCKATYDIVRQSNCPY